jgi:hypothetical protein
MPCGDLTSRSANAGTVADSMDPARADGPDPRVSEVSILDVGSDADRTGVHPPSKVSVRT